jgi:uncharacterized integral membrane protein
MNSKFLILFGLLVAIGTTVFSFQNNQIVTVDFIKWEFELSLALLVLLAFSAGFLVTILISLPSQLMKSAKIISLNLKISNLENKLSKKNNNINLLTQEKTDLKKEKDQLKLEQLVRN